MLSPALQKLVPAKDRVKYKANAYADAPPATEAAAYPVVIFSHGFAGYPEQSLDITTHLASWGFVVAAPDHVERSLDGILGTAGQGVPKMERRRGAAGDARPRGRADSPRRAGVLHGLVDAEPGRRGRATPPGAGAAYAFASADPRVKAWISYSVGFGGRGGPRADRAAEAGHGHARHDRRHHPAGGERAGLRGDALAEVPREGRDAPATSCSPTSA